MNEEFVFLKESLQLVGTWLVHNHYVLQFYSHAFYNAI